MHDSKGLPRGWENVTPRALRCVIGSCPGIYRSPAGRYVIVGRTLSSDEVAALLPDRVGAHESAIEIDSGFIDGLDLSG